MAGLRNAVRIRLDLWGLADIAPEAQLCASELAANVIKHVGPGTRARLAVSMNGGRLRIEVSDPDTRGVPVLTTRANGEEHGRGLVLVDALADRWGCRLKGRLEGHLVRAGHRPAVVRRSHGRTPGREGLSPARAARSVRSGQGR
ncbi:MULTISPECIES: ATP-binding protein [Streptomyces]|uniref:ATP-binding protein n=1 Tax=Streptomyces caviscabies TaxID=90079 RepID=A0ABW2M4Y2_9ACTN